MEVNSFSTSFYQGLSCLWRHNDARMIISLTWFHNLFSWDSCHFKGNRPKHTILKWHKGVGSNRLGCGMGVGFGRLEISNKVNVATWRNGATTWKDLLLFGINSNSCHVAAWGYGVVTWERAVSLTPRQETLVLRHGGRRFSHLFGLFFC